MLKSSTSVSSDHSTAQWMQRHSSSKRTEQQKLYTETVVSTDKAIKTQTTRLCRAIQTHPGWRQAVCRCTCLHRLASPSWNRREPNHSLRTCGTVTRARVVCKSTGYKRPQQGQSVSLVREPSKPQQNKPKEIHSGTHHEQTAESQTCRQHTSTWPPAVPL